MLILGHDVLEVVLGSFMDHLRPAINGMFEFLSLAKSKRITFAFILSFCYRVKISLLRCFYTCPSIPLDGITCTREGEGVFKNKCPHGGVWINLLVCKIFLFSVALKENLSTKTVVYGLFVIPPLSTPEFEPGSELRTS